MPNLVMMPTIKQPPAKKPSNNPIGRPKDSFDPALMRQVARLYYLEGKSRRDISNALNIDARKTSTLLDMAQKLGVVRIQIQEPVEEQLEAQLQKKYPALQRALIAPGPLITTWEQYQELLTRFGVLAADYFEELVKHNPRGKPLHVAVAGGQQRLDFALAVPQLKREDVYVHITALTGRARLSGSANPVHPIAVASILWSRCGSIPGHCEYATVSPYQSKRPGPASREAVKDELKLVRANTAIREVVEAMDSLDVVFGGIGVINPAGVHPDLVDHLSIAGLLQNVITSQQLENEKAVGDFAYAVFNAKGERDERWRFFVTAGDFSEDWGIDFYKRMVETHGKKVVAFGSPFHLPAIKVMLEAKICNVLIIDEGTARKLVEGS